jgi:hypothetical protein
MKGLRFLFMSLLVVFIVIGCEVKNTSDESDPEAQSLTIANSANSTFRIIDAKANILGGGLLHFDIGDGIHKGKSKSFFVTEENCDKDWAINVWYRDRPWADVDDTRCQHILTVKCGKINVVTFNNNTCGGG